MPDHRGGLRRPDRVRGPDRRQHVHAARPEAGAVRRPGPAQPVWRHHQRPGGRARRRPRRGAGRQHRRRDAAVFEPVHGSAPKYAGQDKANPTAPDPVSGPDAPSPGYSGGRRPGGDGGPRGHRGGSDRDPRPGWHGRHGRLRRRDHRPLEALRWLDDGVRPASASRRSRPGPHARALHDEPARRLGAPSARASRLRSGLPRSSPTLLFSAPIWGPLFHVGFEAGGYVSPFFSPLDPSRRGCRPGSSPARS